MVLNEIKGEGSITIAVEGNVDTNTAPQLQQQILTSFQKTSHIVLDLTACPYLSSAGLRALLIGQKTAASKGGSMKLVNVADSVQKILKVTGFDKLLTIE